MSVLFTLTFTHGCRKHFLFSRCFHLQRPAIIIFLISQTEQSLAQGLLLVWGGEQPRLGIKHHSSAWKAVMLSNTLPHHNNNNIVIVPSSHHLNTYVPVLFFLDTVDTHIIPIWFSIKFLTRNGSHIGELPQANSTGVQVMTESVWPAPSLNTAIT